MKLNVACGMMKKKDFINIDCNELCKPDIVRDVLRGLPYSNGVADEIACEHFVEHLKADDFIFLMNEFHRVLKTGGLLSIKAPHASGKHAIIDPTHCRFVTEYTFDFFMNQDWNSVSVGVRGWYEPVSCEVIKGELQLVLKKVDAPTRCWSIDPEGKVDGKSHGGIR